MKYYKISADDLISFNESVHELEILLDERIVDLHEVKGAMQARHAYCFYREKLWEVKRYINENVKETKSENP